MDALWLPAREPDALTRPRMMLAARLRDLRERTGVDLNAAGAAIGSLPLLRAMECGVTASSPHHVMTLASLYEVTDHATRSTLLRLALSSRQEGWWEPYRRLIRSWFLPYLGAEQTAHIIRCYAVHRVPDLLQHPAYAEHMLRLAHPDAAEEELKKRLELRLRRQRVLYGADPPHLWAIIDETVLLRHVGPPEILYRQLDHLLDLCELPHLSIQIIPLATGTILPGGPITLVQVLPEQEVKQLVYLQQLDTALYPEDVESHRHAMNLLAILAARPDQTPRLLRQLIKNL